MRDSSMRHQFAKGCDANIHESRAGKGLSQTGDEICDHVIGIFSELVRRASQEFWRSASVHNCKRMATVAYSSQFMRGVESSVFLERQWQDRYPNDNSASLSGDLRHGRS
jgi:hypothetical protein